MVISPRLKYLYFQVGHGLLNIQIVQAMDKLRYMTHLNISKNR